MDYPAGRRDSLSRFVKESGVDGFLVTNVANVTYLTGFTGDSSYLFVGRDRTILVSDGRYEVQIKEECPGLEVHIRPPSQKITPASAEVLGKLGWRRVGFEAAHLTVGEFGRFRELLPTVDWKSCDETVEKLRAVKDVSEVAAIREAIGIAERAFVRFRASLKTTDTEKQLSDRMEMLMREEGAKCSSFPTIVGVDERAALPHAPLTRRPIGDGHLLLVDWGANGGLYKSDLTRTLAIGKATPKLEQVYAAVLKAQRHAIAMIRPGVKGHDVDVAVRAVLDEAGLNQFFNHGLGHGIGLDVHEAPGLRTGSDSVLEPGNVLTVEPGVYLPDWGGVRIEDDVLVTADGCEVLTNVEKEPALVIGF